MLDNAKRYIEAATAADDEAQLIVLPGAGHFEIVAVDAKEWQDVRRAALQLSEKLLSSCGDN